VTVLAELGLAPTAESRVTLVAPPDAVLAEAGRMKPRPGIASTLQVAQPAPRIAWWVERSLLTPAVLGRLHWMLQAADGDGWLVLDPEDEGLMLDELRDAVAQTPLRTGEERQLSNGDIALQVLPG
jgi:hypothetical protein